MAVNLTTIATAAAEDLGVIDAGGTITAAEIAQALAIGNLILDNWSSDQLMLPQLLITSNLPITSGVASYTIGPALTWAMSARPLKIVAAVHRNTMYALPLETPVDVVNAQDWAAIADRATATFFVKSLFYDRQQSNAKCYLSPPPLGGTMEITTWSALTQFADATTAITFPAGYQLAFQYALGKAMAPKYGVTPSETFMKNYEEAMGRMMKLNSSLVREMQAQQGA